MDKVTLPIKGMHCKSCEIMIEDELVQVKGVEKAQVDRKTGEAIVYYKGSVPHKSELHKAVKNAGYEVGKSAGLPFISKKPNDYYELAIAFAVTILLFLIGNELGIFKIGVQGNGSYRNLPVVFLVGLTAGVSTCMALVGGLVLGIASRFAQENARASALEKFKPHLFFNLGRITSFFILGGLVGYAGSIFKLSAGLLGAMTVFVGVVMVFLGMQLIEIFPRLSGFAITLPKSISRAFGIQNKEESGYSDKSAFLLGGFTFFVPCGFTQAMQLFAMASGSFLTGALTMTVFALGTAPGLLGVGGLTSVIKGGFSKMFFKFAGVVVIALALFNIANGLNLAGVRFSIFATQPVRAGQDPNVVIENGIQIIHMSQKSNGYSPNSFTIKKGMPVKWIVKSEDPYSCASSLVVPKLNIRALLTEKEQIFEFTPDEAGEIRFTCSMGMYSGVFNVIDEKNSSGANKQGSTGKQNSNAAVTANNSVPQVGTCGGGGCGCGQKAQKQAAVDADKTPPAKAEAQGSLQVLKATYSPDEDVQPSRFTVKAGSPVQLDIEAKEDGFGCMGSIMIPGLFDEVKGFEKGKTTTLAFTPEKSGTYTITCGMGVPRGSMIVE